MTMEMEWTQDFCLACDRQTSGGAYCSQSCRLADLENASNGSEPASPIYHDGGASWAFPSPGTTSGFYLPPPIDFATYRATAPSNTTHRVSRQISVPAPQPATYTHEVSLALQQAFPLSREKRSTSSLQTSSSRSSLSSMASQTSEDSHLSAQVRVELRNYSNAFDRARDSKRRITL